MANVFVVLNFDRPIEPDEVLIGVFSKKENAETAIKQCKDAGYEEIKMEEIPLNECTI